MSEIRVPETLWAGSMAPEGVLERWRRPAGACVEIGDVVAEVRVEDACHELPSPGSGRLAAFARPGDVVEPGTIIGNVEDEF